MVNTDSSYWRKRVLQHWDLVNHLAGKRFPDSNTAEEAALYVLEALKADDWRRARTYQGRSRFTTFLTVIVNRLLEDFSRSKFGRFRAPKWIRRQGPLWEQVYRLLCEERLSVDDVVETIAAAAPGGRSRETVVESASVILAETPDCGRRRLEAVSVDPAALDTENRFGWTGPPPSPEDLVTARERAQLVAGLGRRLLGGTEDPSDESTGPVENIMARFTQAEFEMAAEERLFLKTIYEDGLSVVAAGRLLGWDTNESHRRLRQILRRLRRAFEETGLAMEMKAVLVQNEAE